MREGGIAVIWRGDVAGYVFEEDAFAKGESLCGV